MANFSTKLASTVSAAAIVASSMSVSLVSAASEFLPYAEALVNKKVINAQTTEAGYRLNDQITRAELAKVAANLGGYTAVSCTGKVFTDVNSSLGDLCDAIETLAAAKVISTSSNTFRPSANVTRAEMTKMILGALGKTPSTTKGIFSDVTSSLGDLEGFINAAAEQNIVNKGTNFYPNNTGSRGEVFKIAARAAGLSVDTTAPSTPTATTGTVSVSAVGTAVAQYVPMNASSVKVGTVKLTATGGDTKVSSLTVSRSGLGMADDITVSKGVRAVVGGKIVSSNADYYNSSSQQAQIYFAPALEIKNGQSVDVDIIVSLGKGTGANYKAAEPNSQHQFAVTAVNGTNVSTATTLGLLNTTSFLAPTVTANLKNVTSTATPAKLNQRIVDVELGGAERDVTIKGFSVVRSNYNSVGKRAAYDLTSVLANAKVYLDGKEVGTATISRDEITVTGLDTLITSGRKTYEIRADVLLDSTVDEIALEFDSSSNVSGIDTTTGQIFRVDPSLPTAKSPVPTTTGEATHSNVVNISLGNVNNSFTTNTAKKTVAIDSSNVEFFNGTLTSEVPVIVNKVKVINATTGTAINPGTTSNPTFARNEFIIKNNGRTVGTIKATDLFTAGTTGVTTDAYILVDKDNKANITIESSLQNGVEGDLRLKVVLEDIKDINNRNAKLRTDSVTGGVTEVKGADLKVSGTNVSSTNLRLAKNGELETKFTLRSENKSKEFNSIKFKNIAASATAADLSKTIDLEESTIRIDGTEYDILSTSTISATEMTLVLDSTVVLDKDQDEVVELTLKSNDDISSGTTTNIETQNTKKFQLQLTGVALGSTSTSATRTITGVVTVGEVLDVTTTAATTANTAKFTLKNSTDNDITLTAAKFTVSANQMIGTSVADLPVTSLKINGVRVETPTANVFELNQTKLQEIGISEIEEGREVEVVIENNTLNSADVTKFTVRLNTLTYGSNTQEVELDARASK